MKIFGKSYYEAFFYLGIGFGVVIALNRRFKFLPDFAVGFLTGLAIVFMLVAGALRFKEKYLKAAEIRRGDERMQMISGKAHEAAYYALLALGAVAILSFSFLGEAFIRAALGIAGAIFFLFIAQLIAGWIYAKRL